MKQRHKKLRCPVCGDKLGGDKDPVFSERGFIYRKRVCLSCHTTVRTKQGKEEITHVELPEEMSTRKYEADTPIYYNTNFNTRETSVTLL